MITDENGNNSIEMPEIPVEQWVHYIVKDYRRMFLDNVRLEGKCSKYKNTIGKMNNHVFALHRIIMEQKKVADTLAAMLKEEGIALPDCYKNLKVHKF